MSKARETDPAELWERYCEETPVARRTPQGAMAFAFDAITPAIQPQQTRDAVIKECAKIAKNYYQTEVSSRILRANIEAIGGNIAKAISALAHTRPECSPTENKGE